jgi:hypothetical protein
MGVSQGQLIISGNPPEAVSPFTAFGCGCGKHLAFKRKNRFGGKGTIKDPVSSPAAENQQGG